MRTFTYTHERQREVWLSLVATFTDAANNIKAELAKDTPDADVLDLQCGAIQHDLNALRFAYLYQLGALKLKP